MSADGSVSIGLLDRVVFLRVEGRGTLQNSAGLRDAVRQMIQRGHREFIVDLEDCESMDSTFMGTLAGAALRLREFEGGGLSVVRVNDRSRELLTGLGLDHLFPIASDQSQPVSPEETVPVGNGSAADSRQAALEAHEALVRAYADNAIKFRDVIEFMKQELGGASADG